MGVGRLTFGVCVFFFFWGGGGQFGGGGSLLGGGFFQVGGNEQILAGGGEAFPITQKVKLCTLCVLIISHEHFCVNLYSTVA